MILQNAKVTSNEIQIAVCFLPNKVSTRFTTALRICALLCLRLLPMRSNAKQCEAMRSNAKQCEAMRSNAKQPMPSEATLRVASLGKGQEWVQHQAHSYARDY